MELNVLQELQDIRKSTKTKKSKTKVRLSPNKNHKVKLQWVDMTVDQQLQLLKAVK